MGRLKNYLLQVQENCSDEIFGQTAVEWAILEGHVKLTGDLDQDCRAILGEGAAGYDAICTGYRNYCRNMEAQDALEQIITQSILQPIPTKHEHRTNTTLLPLQACERGTTPEVAAQTRGVDLPTQVQRLAGARPHPDAEDVQPQAGAAVHHG